MLIKKDFQQAIVDFVAAYPAVAPLYQAGDPRILQSLDAMAHRECKNCSLPNQHCCRSTSYQRCLSHSEC